MKELVPGCIHFVEHPVRLGGGTLHTRMTIITLSDGGLLLHSPVPIDDELRADITRLGEVRAIVAPSNCHNLFIADAQRAFPAVPTYAIDALLTKRKDLALTPMPEDAWSTDMDHVTIGNRIMREVVFLHRASRTVVAVDLVENFRDETAGVDRMMRFWVKLLGMWNKPRPAPELRLFTRDHAAAREAIETILAWDFDRILIAHGEPLVHGAKDALREAWNARRDMVSERVER